MDYVTIGDLLKNGDVEITTGPFGTQLKASEYRSVGTPVLNVKNVGFGRVVISKLDRVGEETIQRLQRHILRVGDIVFGRKGAVDRHAYITENEDGWMQGSDCIRLRVLSDHYDSRFMSYAFLTKKHRDFLMGMCSHGTTMASLNQGILEKISIPALPIVKQQVIANTLSKLDEKINLNNIINDNLEQQAQAIYNSIVEQSEQFITLSEYVNIKHGYAFSGDFISTENNNVVLVTPGNFKIGGGFQENKCKFFTSEYPEEYVLHSGDLIVTMTDLSKNADTLGYGAIVPDNPERVYLHNQRIGLVHLKTSDLYKDYLYWYLRSFEYHMRIVGSASGSTVKHTSPGRIIEQKVPVPKESEIMKLYALRNIDKLIAENDLECQKLAEIRDSLLPKLMSGKIDVSNISV